MSKAFEDTVYLFACAARGIDFDKEAVPGFERIYELAAQQNIWTVIYPLISKLKAEGKIEIPEHMQKQVETDFFRKYTFFNNRRENARRLFDGLRKSDIRFCLLKGDSVAQYYAEPLCRGSSDIDIKIEPEDADECTRFLEQNGYRVHPLKPGHHHFECVHPMYGLLEVHVSFCMDITNAICFKNTISYNEEYREEDIAGIGRVNLMGYTDGLVFLIMHYIKHFISSGAGIRQIMDIALYYENNKEHINMQQVRQLTAEWGFSEFLNVIFEIADKYLMSDIPLAKTNAEKTKQVMQDIEMGGVFGYVDVSRIDFYRFYLKLRAEEVGVNSAIKHNSLVWRIFLPVKELEQRVPCLKKCRLLYPFAVVKNALTVMSARAQRRKLAAQAEQTHIDDRLTMLKDVGLL